MLIINILIPLIFPIPEKLRGRLVFRGEQSPRAENVFQELDREVLQMMITVKILKSFEILN